ncbi:MAG: DUF2000 family protein [Opitutales bacterium]|jgi:hypothetical protein|nr:DUF2000 family protein [Opitutales bacterium]|tara:strand:+ start:1017 stop:1424 length:408 start_codon:yes stop_codon:yes gene_type:complete
MNFDTKIAVVVREDLEVWQKLNVTAFTISGIAGTQEVMGKEYEDGSSRKYLPMIMQPILIFSAGRDEIRMVYAKAVSRDVVMTIYTEELFSTPNDDANRTAVRAVGSDDLKLVGMALRGRKKPMDRILKGLTLHP